MIRPGHADRGCAGLIFPAATGQAVAFFRDAGHLADAQLPENLNLALVLDQEAVEQKWMAEPIATLQADEYARFQLLHGNLVFRHAELCHLVPSSASSAIFTGGLGPVGQALCGAPRTGAPSLLARFPLEIQTYPTIKSLRNIFPSLNYVNSVHTQTVHLFGLYLNIFILQYKFFFRADWG
jgi:hypothetical protein